jgi:hypothetical protein
MPVARAIPSGRRVSLLWPTTRQPATAATTPIASHIASARLTVPVPALGRAMTRKPATPAAQATTPTSMSGSADRRR